MNEHDAPQHAPAPVPSYTTPACWKCGYTLAGLRVEDVCPECGTPAHSIPSAPPSDGDAQAALIWGIVALCLFFVCIGPLAGFVAIPAIIKGGRVDRLVKAGRLPAASAQGAKAGLILGWVTAGLSLAAVAFYALMIAVSVLIP